MSLYTDRVARRNRNYRDIGGHVLPAHRKSQEQGRRAASVSNERQLIMARKREELNHGPCAIENLSVGAFRVFAGKNCRKRFPREVARNAKKPTDYEKDGANSIDRVVDVRLGDSRE